MDERVVGRMNADMLVLDNVRYQWPGSGRWFGPVSQRAPGGRWIALIGPNGSGKSTLLRLAAGYWKRTAGTVWIHGHNLDSLKPHDRAQLVAHVPQTLETSFDLTVREVVEMGRLSRLSWKDRVGGGNGSADRVDQVLHETAMTALANRPLSSLSGGEGRRALLAAALAQEAPLLLLDEPTAYLDPGHAVKFLDLIRTQVDHGEVTVLMAYHDLATVSLYADELWVMDQGQLVLSGTPHEVFGHSLLRRIYGTELVQIEHPRTHRPMLIFP